MVAPHPVQASGASTEIQPTGLDGSRHVTADRRKVQPPVPASHTYTSGRLEVNPQDPTGQTATDLKKQATSLISPGAPAEEPVSDGEQFSNHISASPVDEEGEVSDL